MATTTVTVKVAMTESTYDEGRAGLQRLWIEFSLIGGETGSHRDLTVEEDSWPI
jgi:hypothetical protein